MTTAADLYEALELALAKLPPIVLQVVKAYGDTRALEAKLEVCDELSVGCPQTKPSAERA